jgi:hypothetical protein
MYSDHLTIFYAFFLSLSFSLPQSPSLPPSLSPVSSLSPPPSLPPSLYPFPFAAKILRSYAYLRRYNIEVKLNLDQIPNAMKIGMYVLLKSKSEMLCEV